MCAALGILARAEGRVEEALGHLERATELAPERPHFWYQLALTAESAEILPPSLRRSRAAEACERAASAPGGFVPADERIAARLGADRHPEQAIARLKGSLSRLALGRGASARDSPFLKLALAEIALREGWLHEARRWAEDAEKAGPGWRRVHLFWARYHRERGNVTRARASYREAMALDASDLVSREALAAIHMNAGEGARAIAELRKALSADPGRLAGYTELARAELEAGRYTDAEETLRAALRLFVRSPLIRRRLGEVHLRKGDIEKAKPEWDEALRLHPGQHDLRREVASLRGGEDDFSLPFAIDVKKAMAESKGPEDYPRADVILVVDQTVDRIYEDGSYTEITHSAQKALTTEGVEELSHIRVEGELLEARTHLPDGRTLEPAVLPGRDTLTMPGLEAGGVVEYRYRREHPTPAGGFVRLPRWYFRSLETPHQVSDYVVIAPKSMDLSVVVKNWDRDPPGGADPEEEFVEHPPTEEGDLRTYRWVARNTRPLDAASGHTHISELLPHVLVGRARTWEDMNWEILDLFLGRTRLTEALRAEAASVVAGCPGEARPRARAIFRHVNDLVRAKADLYEANQILLCRAGNRAILLATLLRAAGLDARFALVRPRPEAISPKEGPGEPVWALPEPRLFRDTVVCLTCPDGAKLWLDPGGPYAPFGATVPRFQGGIAYVVSAEGGLLATLPWGPIREHGESTRTELVLDPEGDGFRGTRELSLFGAVGGIYKQRFAESGASWRETWAQSRLNGALGGARLEKLDLVGLEDADSPFTLRVGFVLEAFLDPPGPWKELPTALAPLGMTKRYVPQRDRSHPQKIHAPLVRRDAVTITIPNVEAWSPPPSHVEQTSFGSYNLTFTWEGTRLAIRREVTIMPQVVPTERHDDFVRFCRSVDAAEAAPLRARVAALVIP